MKNNNYRGLKVEENFDIDKRIDKIKNQMGEEYKDVLDPDNSIFRNENSSDEIPKDIMESIPVNEPSLDNYSESADEQNIGNDIENTEALEMQNDDNQNDSWQDPFASGENDAVKKYVIYIAKDFVPYFDEMDTDGRSAYVNEALQLKIDLEGKDRKWHLFKRILRHIIVSVFTLIIAIPSLFWLADKSIKATVQNYSYVQENFEKLYKERVDRERTIQKIKTMRLGL